MEEERNVQLVESSEKAQKLKELKEHIGEAESTLIAAAVDSLEHSEQTLEALFISENDRLICIADLASQLQGDVDDLQRSATKTANDYVRTFIFSAISRLYAKRALR